MKSFLFNRNNFLIGFTLAIIITAASLPFINIGTKYKLTVQKDLKQRLNYIDIYRDLYHDGNSVNIHIIKDFEGTSAIVVRKSGRTLFQWNLPGKITIPTFLYTADYNGDGTDEIFAFSHSHDSVFLSGYDIVSNKICYSPLFLKRFKYYNNQCDITIWDARFHKFNANGDLTLVVPIHSGFSKSSRSLYVIDLKKRTYITSPKAATEIQSEINFIDLGGKCSDDITGVLNAPGNFSTNYPLSDQFLWFLVYDSTLGYLFPPVMLGHSPGTVHVYPFKIKSANLLAVFTQANL